MKSSLLAASFTGLLMLAAGCTTNTSNPPATMSGGGEVIQVTADVRADLVQQGLDPDEEVCRREDQIGSVIPKRTCMTRAMWAARTRDSQDSVRDIQNNALRTRDPNAGG